MPTGPADAACLRTFVKSFGRRALRRPLIEEEIVSYLTLQSFAVEGNDFNIAVKLVVQALLQEPDLVYRIEVGTPVSGRDGVALAEAIASYRDDPDLAWTASKPSLEDVFIDLMGRSGDNVQ